MQHLEADRHGSAARRARSRARSSGARRGQTPGPLGFWDPFTEQAGGPTQTGSTPRVATDPGHANGSVATLSEAGIAKTVPTPQADSAVTRRVLEADLGVLNVPVSGPRCRASAAVVPCRSAPEKCKGRAEVRRPRAAPWRVPRSVTTVTPRNTVTRGLPHRLTGAVAGVCFDLVLNSPAGPGTGQEALAGALAWVV